MKIIRRILNLLPLLLAWIMLSVFFWGWIFTLITDTDPAHKITVYIDAEVSDSTSLAVALEDGLPAGIRMVKVHPFSYAMFNVEDIQSADFFIVPASHVSEYQEWFCPLPEPESWNADLLMTDGVAYGVPVYLPDLSVAAAASVIQYRIPGAPDEPYYLFFSQASRHISGHSGAVDNAALPLAEKLISLP